MAGFVVALTGGIASGKSAASRFFSELGIVVADADIAARKIVEPGQSALNDIVDTFGSHLLLDGQLDRRALRELIFENSDAKKKLESITHPRIRELLMHECEQAPGAYAIVAIPLLAEGNRSHYAWLDRILVVDAPRELQKSRLLSRDNISSELAEKMLDAQASRSQRLAIANDVISNTHDLSSLKQGVLRLDIRYRRLAKASVARTG